MRTKNVVICGAGEVGRYTAEVLYRQGHLITIIDTDYEALKRLDSVLEARFLHGSSCDADILMEANINECDTLIAASSLDEINLVTAAVSKKLGAKKVISRVHSRTFYNNTYLTYKEAFYCDSLICPEELTSKAISAKLHDPGVVAVQRFAQGKIEIHQFKISDTMQIFHRPLKEIDFPTGVRVCLIKRGKNSIIPDAETMMTRGDIVTIVIPLHSLATVREMFQHSHKTTRRGVALVGASPIAEWILSQMDTSKFSVRLFEPNLDIAKKIASRYPSITVLNADPIDSPIFDSEHLEECGAFIACSLNEEHNILGSLQAKARGVESTFAIVHNSTYMSALGGIGIDYPFSPRIEAAKEVLRLIDDSPIKVLSEIDGGRIRVFELQVAEGSAGSNKTLRKINFPRATIIAAIQRGEEVIAPSPSHEVKSGDILVIIGPTSMERTLYDTFVKGR